MKTSDLVREYAARNSRSKTVWFAMKLLGMDTSILENEDGGPGSGNWGHKGRPGLVGGSGKGGGSQYRGGRSDVGYFSSRSDWLNGLKGERQHKAVKMIQAWKPDENSGDNMNDTPEQNLMKNATTSQKGEFLGYLSEARSWEKKADRLTEEYWDETDQKLADALAKKYGVQDLNGKALPDDSSVDKWSDEDLECWYDLKSKGMGGPVSGKEIPEELQYEAGLKERPAINRWTKNLTADQRENVLSLLRFMTGVRDREALEKAMDDPETMKRVEENAFRRAFGDYQIDRGLKRYIKNKFEALGISEKLTKIDEEMKNRLSDSDFEKLKKMATYSSNRDESIIESLDYENQLVRMEGYAILNKMLGGCDATEIVNQIAEQKRKEEEERRKEIERFRKEQEERERQQREAEEQKKAEEERKRTEALKEGNSVYTKTGERLGIARNEVKTHEVQPDEDTIIDRIAGLDKTSGSCVSCALTYAANKLGFDVLDFRGGESRSMIANRSNYQDIIDSPGVRSVVIEEKNDLRAAKDLIKKMEKGKEYILTTGRHASVVRLSQDGKPEYLELQDEGDRKGFKLLGNTPREIDAMLRNRFGCRRSHSSRYSGPYSLKNYLVEIDSLRGCKTFEKALPYINTNADQQRKGAGGSVK